MILCVPWFSLSLSAFSFIQKFRAKPLFFFHFVLVPHIWIIPFPRLISPPPPCCVCVQLMSLFGKKCDFGFFVYLYEYFVSLLLYIYVFSRFAMIQSSSIWAASPKWFVSFFLFWLHWAKVVWECMDRLWCRILFCFFFFVYKSKLTNGQAVIRTTWDQDGVALRVCVSVCVILAVK